MERGLDLRCANWSGVRVSFQICYMMREGNGYEMCTIERKSNGIALIFSIYGLGKLKIIQRYYRFYMYVNYCEWGIRGSNL